MDALSHISIKSVLSGPGDGEKCDACELPVTQAQLVTDVVLVDRKRTMQLHVECFQLWDDETRALKA